MRILKLVVVLIFAGCVNQVQKILPSRNLQNYIFDSQKEYSTVVWSKWESGRHTILQIPVTIDMDKPIRKVSFFYYNAEYPLDSVAVTDVEISSFSVREANVLLDQIVEVHNLLPSLQTADRIVVAGGISSTFLVGRKVFSFDNLCAAIALRYESSEDVALHCRLYTLEKSLLKLLDMPSGEICPC